MKTKKTTNTSPSTTTVLNEPAAALLAATTPAPDTAPPMTAAEIEHAIREVEAVYTELAQLESMQEKNARDIATLAGDCNFNDTKALDQIGRLQVLAGLYPRRIETRQNQIPAAARHLLNLTGHFICKTLSPKIGNVRARLAVEVKKSLSPHIADEFLLQRAILSSSQLTAVNAVYCTWDVSVPPDKAVAYARRILGSWNDIQVIEQAPLQTIRPTGEETYSGALAKEQQRRKEMTEQGPEISTSAAQ